MIQTFAVDVIVVAAAAWLVWSFAPAGLRRWLRFPRVRRDRVTAARPDADCGCEVADGNCQTPGLPLRAEELGG